MSEIRWVAAVVGVAIAAAASAQGARTVVPVEGSGLERAQRAAANPLKAILEASRIKRRPDGEPTAVADVAPVRRGAPRAPAASDGVSGIREETSARPAPAQALVTPGEGDDGITVIGHLPADLARRSLRPADDEDLPLVRLSPGSAAAGAPAALSSPPQLSSTPPAPLPVPLPVPAELKPKLVTMVEPAVPQHLLDQLTRSEYGVTMTIRADGSVADVAVVPPAPRQLQRYVAEALERWKFEPLPADRSHRVVLVFNPVR